METLTFVGFAEFCTLAANQAAISSEVKPVPRCTLLPALQHTLHQPASSGFL